MATEHAPPRKSGLYGALPQLGVPAGLLLANGVVLGLSASMSNEAFLSYGWRIPFLISIVLVGVGLYIRLRILESPAFENVKEQQTEAKVPLMDTFRNHPRAVFTAMAARIGENALFYLFTVFILEYGQDTLGLVLRLGSSRPELHRSGGDLAAAFEVGQALVALGAVAVADVASQGVVEGAPVEVVGVLDHELADRQEVALDAVEIAGVGRRRDQLDVVVVGKGADVRCPVGAEVVLDPVDAQSLGVGEPDLAHEGEVVGAAPARLQPDPEPVVMDVVGTEDVACAVAAVERRALTLGPLALGPPAAGVGRRLIGPIWSKLTTTASSGARL